MNVTVFGSKGGTGRAVTQALLAAGHKVTAFFRDPTTLGKHPNLIPQSGDAMNRADVERAVTGADAVIASLGNSQNSFALLLGAKRTTPANICEIGTRNMIDGMGVSGPATGQWFASEEGQLRKAEVTRADVASFLAGELTSPHHILRTVTLSG